MNKCKNADYGFDPTTAEEIADVAPGNYKILIGTKDGDIIATEEKKFNFEILEKLAEIQEKADSEELSCTYGHKEATNPSIIYPTTSSLKNPMVFEKSTDYDGELVADISMVIVSDEDNDNYNLMPAQIYIDDKDKKTPLVSYYGEDANVWTGVLDRPAFIGNEHYCYGMFIPLTIAPDQALFASNFLNHLAENIKNSRPYYSRELPNAKFYD